MDTAINRQIVQKGLDRRAAERRDAELEKQARKLRLIINANHEAHLAALDAAQEPELPQEEPAAEPGYKLKRKKEERAARAAEAAYCIRWYGFLLRVFTPLFVAASTIGLHNIGVMPGALAIPCAIVACLLSVEAFASRFLHRKCKAV